MKKQVDLENITILDLLYILTKKYNGSPALQIKDKDRIRGLSYDELREKSVGVSAFLIQQGFEAGSHVAILTENRPEWAVSFFGIISAACITIPIDAKLSMTEVLFILNDSGARCLFVSGKFLNKILEHKSELAGLTHVVSLDPHDAQGVFYLGDINWQEGQVRNRPQEVKPEDSVLIVYTSGTTGVAKGVELSYRNILFEAMSLYELIQFSPQDSFVSILPLNHMLEITGGLIAPLYGGATVTYCPTLKATHIISLMRETKATGMVCVPLVLKMFYNGITKEAEKLPALKKKIFGSLLGISKFLLKFKIRIGPVFFRNIHRTFGKKFKYFVCGGAPLDAQLERNFDALGFTILQGYGLTETSPVASVNTPKHRKYGSVGRPLKGVDIKIGPGSPGSSGGEILIRGPNVMKGYYNNSDKTSEVLKEGWFYTGDLGYLDEDNFLYISGRAKNLIVLGGGKKIFPEEVEQVMNESPYIKEICVLGRQADKGLKEGTEQVYAVIVPDLDKFPAEGKDDRDAVRRAISKDIADLGKNLAEYKRISEFELYFEELPKTSTRKIKRNQVQALIAERS
jgi:long-chain acyl-CoA synthetase